MFQIKKGFVPPEEPKQPSIEWPFKDMKVGDCVIFERDTDPKILKKAYNYQFLYASRHNKKFKYKTIDGQLHIWRVF